MLLEEVLERVLAILKRLDCMRKTAEQALLCTTSFPILTMGSNIALLKKASPNAYGSVRRHARSQFKDKIWFTACHDVFTFLYFIAVPASVVWCIIGLTVDGLRLDGCGLAGWAIRVVAAIGLLYLICTVFVALTSCCWEMRRMAHSPTQGPGATTPVAQSQPPQAGPAKFMQHMIAPGFDEHNGASLSAGEEANKDRGCLCVIFVCSQRRRMRCSVVLRAVLCACVAIGLCVGQQGRTKGYAWTLGRHIGIMFLDNPCVIERPATPIVSVVCPSSRALFWVCLATGILLPGLSWPGCVASISPSAIARDAGCLCWFHRRGSHSATTCKAHAASLQQ
jgi:hypothetical protein